MTPVVRFADDDQAPAGRRSDGHGACAQCESDADVPRSAGHGVRGRAVHAENRQHEGEPAQPAQKRRAHPLRPRQNVDPIPERRRFHDGKVRIVRLNPALQDGNQTAGFPRGAADDRSCMESEIAI